MLSLRSSRRASNALAPSDGRGGGAIRISSGSGAEARRKSPWRSSRSNLSWSLIAFKLFVVSGDVGLFTTLE